MSQSLRELTPPQVPRRRVVRALLHKLMTGEIRVGKLELGIIGEGAA